MSVCSQNHQPSFGLAFFRFKHKGKHTLFRKSFFGAHLISSFFDILYLELIYLDAFDHVFSWYSWISSSPIKRPISTNKYFNVALRQSLSDAIIVAFKSQIPTNNCFNQFQFVVATMSFQSLTRFQWFNVSTFTCWLLYKNI